MTKSSCLSLYLIVVFVLQGIFDYLHCNKFHEPYKIVCCDVLPMNYGLHIWELDFFQIFGAEKAIHVMYKCVLSTAKYGIVFTDLGFDSLLLTFYYI